MPSLINKLLAALVVVASFGLLPAEARDHNGNWQNNNHHSNGTKNWNGNKNWNKNNNNNWNKNRNWKAQNNNWNKNNNNWNKNSNWNKNRNWNRTNNVNIGNDWNRDRSLYTNNWGRIPPARQHQIDKQMRQQWKAYNNNNYNGDYNWNTYNNPAFFDYLHRSNPSLLTQIRGWF